jgi:hypothetical protein
MIQLALFALAQATTAPSPDDIFRQAQRVWQARVVPGYLSFRIDCENTFLASLCSETDRVEFIVRMSDGRSYARTVAAGAASKVLLRGGYIAGPLDTPLGFYRALPDGSASPLPSLPPNLTADPLQTIATVTASAEVYDVLLAGEEFVGERLCYHLVLHPRIDPDRYPLRALWVEESSFQIVQLTYDRPYDEKHAHALVWYRFAPIGPAAIWTIVHIEADATLREGSSTRTERVVDDLSDISFLASVPDSYFESELPPAD